MTREQIVRERRRLRGLGVRVRGEQRLAMLPASVDRDRSKVQACIDDTEDELPLPHPVHRHVDVVAAARGVKSAGDVLATRLDENALDV